MCYHKIGRLKDSTRTFSVLQNSCSAYRISYHWHLLVSDSCDPVIHRLGLIKRAAACDGVHKHEAISLAHILHKKLTAQTQLQHSPYQEKGMVHCSHPTGEVLCASNSDHYANLPGLSWQSTPPGPQYQECPANMSATEPNKLYAQMFGQASYACCMESEQHRVMHNVLHSNMNIIHRYACNSTFGIPRRHRGNLCWRHWTRSR